MRTQSQCQVQQMVQQYHKHVATQQQSQQTSQAPKLCNKGQVAQQSSYYQDQIDTHQSSQLQQQSYNQQYSRYCR